MKYTGKWIMNPWLELLLLLLSFLAAMAYRHFTGDYTPAQEGDILFNQEVKRVWSLYI